MILALRMAVLSPMQVFAASKRLYISELRMADSVEKLESLSYTVLEKDLNAGGNDGFTYIGCKTTTDPDEAITDKNSTRLRRKGQKTMKRTCLFVLLLLLLSLLTLPVCAEEAQAPTYISAVEVVAVPRSENAQQDAEAAAKAKGFDYVLGYDFNKYSGGDYVALCFTRTDDQSKALHSLVLKFIDRGETPPETYDVYGTTYYLASTTEFNSGTELEQVFLYYTMEPGEGSPLKELYTEDDYKEPDSEGYMRILINGEDNKSALDSFRRTDEPTLEPHCYLYRDYDKTYWSGIEADSNDISAIEMESDGWVKINGLSSVFSPKPMAASLICLIVVFLLGGGTVMLIEKRKRKNRKEK